MAFQLHALALLFESLYEKFYILILCHNEILSAYKNSIEISNKFLESNALEYRDLRILDIIFLNSYPGNIHLTVNNIIIIKGGFKHEVQYGITIDETPLQAS